MDIYVIKTKGGCTFFFQVSYQKARSGSPRQAPYMWNTVWLVSDLKQLDFTYHKIFSSSGRH